MATPTEERKQEKLEKLCQELIELCFENPFLRASGVNKLNETLMSLKQLYDRNRRAGNYDKSRRNTLKDRKKEAPVTRPGRGRGVGRMGGPNASRITASAPNRIATKSKVDEDLILKRLAEQQRQINEQAEALARMKSMSPRSAEKTHSSPSRDAKPKFQDRMVGRMGDNRRLQDTSNINNPSSNISNAPESPSFADQRSSLKPSDHNDVFTFGYHGSHQTPSTRISNEPKIQVHAATHEAEAEYFPFGQGSFSNQKQKPFMSALSQLHGGFSDNDAQKKAEAQRKYREELAEQVRFVEEKKKKEKDEEQRREDIMYSQIKAQQQQNHSQFMRNQIEREEENRKSQEYQAALRMQALEEQRIKQNMKAEESHLSGGRVDPYFEARDLRESFEKRRKEEDLKEGLKKQVEEKRRLKQKQEEAEMLAERLDRERIERNIQEELMELEKEYDQQDEYVEEEPKPSSDYGSGQIQRKNNIPFPKVIHKPHRRSEDRHEASVDVSGSRGWGGYKERSGEVPEGYRYDQNYQAPGYQPEIWQSDADGQYFVDETPRAFQ